MIVKYLLCNGNDDDDNSARRNSYMLVKYLFCNGNDNDNSVRWNSCMASLFIVKR